MNKDQSVYGGAGVRWTPLPKAEAPTEPAGETKTQALFNGAQESYLYNYADERHVTGLPRRSE